MADEMGCESASGKSEDKRRPGEAVAVLATWQKAATQFITFSFPVVLAVAAFTLNSTLTNSTDLAILKAERPGLEESRRNIVNKLDNLTDAVNKLDKRIPDEIPPKWFQDRILQLETDVKALREDVQDIKQGQVKI